MGLWSFADSQDASVRLWLPTLKKDGWPAVREALLRGSETEIQDLACDQATVALAAALIVAAAFGRQVPEMPSEAAQWVAENSSELDTALVPLALDAISRANIYFEWGESDEETGLQTEAKELREAMGELGEDDMYDPSEG